MDDRELEARFVRLQKGMDILLRLEDIHYNPHTDEYEEIPQEETVGVKVSKKSSE